MTARIIDGKAVAAEVRGGVAREAAELRAAGKVAGLAVVLVGEDPASIVYVRNKTIGARECGIEVFDHKLPQDTTQAQLLALISTLNEDPRVDGILVQLPLPKHIDARRTIEAIDPARTSTASTRRAPVCWPRGSPSSSPAHPRGSWPCSSRRGRSSPERGRW